jgi:type I restriction enzyme M protein
MALLAANGSMSSNTKGEGDIRRALVEFMLALPCQLFTNKNHTTRSNWQLKS